MRNGSLFVKQAEEVDRKEYFATPFAAPGLFEQCHHLGEIQNTLINFYEEPEYMHELIDYLTEYELSLAEEICTHLKPDALFHHDDWGSQTSTFMSPEMFEEFYLPGYKKIYGYYKSHGVDLIIHHSDSYAATFVPYMIDMGVDIWQGVMTTNNVPELIQKYGGRMSFMGGIDSAKVDYEGWTRQVIAREVKRACDENGKHYYIPNASIGLPTSTYDGVYDRDLRRDCEIQQRSIQITGKKGKKTAGQGTHPCPAVIFIWLTHSADIYLSIPSRSLLPALSSQALSP